jgi:beta-glucosidase
VVPADAKPAAISTLPPLAALGHDFIWGVSTSSFQIEGAVNEDGRGPSVWDTRGHLGLVANKDTGDVACDHYHRYPEDVALMQKLGIQAYRFSVAWPRVLPQGRGAPNERGLAFYDRLIDMLLAAKIEPWLCLYHWDMPQAIDDLGGWTTREVVGWFADYAALVANRYGDRVKRFVTFNEPSIFTLFGFAFGAGQSDPPGSDRLHRAIHHVNLSHGAAVDVLRARVPGCSIGCVHNVQPCLPPTPADTDGAALASAYWNHAYPDPQSLGSYPALLQKKIEPHMQAGDLERIKRPLDWFGLNHYGPTYMKADPNSRFGFWFGDRPADMKVTPIDWAMDATAFRDTLLEVSRAYGLPVYVTENGMGSNREALSNSGAIVDNDRISYLHDYIAAMNEAVTRGADVRGYFVWSLLDNFEWDSGYGIRFGLAYVDYPTQRRIPKSSFHWYADLIKSARHG